MFSCKMSKGYCCIFCVFYSSARFKNSRCTGNNNKKRYNIHDDTTKNNIEACPLIFSYFNFFLYNCCLSIELHPGSNRCSDKRNKHEHIAMIKLNFWDEDIMANFLPIRACHECRDDIREEYKTGHE